MINALNNFYKNLNGCLMVLYDLARRRCLLNSVCKRSTKALNYNYLRRYVNDVEQNQIPSTCARDSFGALTYSVSISSSIVMRRVASSSGDALAASSSSSSLIW